MIGGFLLSLLGIGGGAGSGGFIFSIIAGVIGAVILLAIYRLIAPRIS
ncbi:MAG: GlsB/YeaQ/YmgE family stress response membrane protein [Xanthobacteraceae bacterium]